MRIIDNTDDLNVFFEEFKKEAYTEFDKALRRAIRKTATQIKDRTIENAKAGIKTYNNHASTKDNYEEGNILDAVRIGKMEDRYDEDDLYTKVHVMGDGKPNSKTFRFRFLEKGTRTRSYTDKKGAQHNLGRIPKNGSPARYFKRARQSIDPTPIFEEELQKAINNINNQ